MKLLPNGLRPYKRTPVFTKATVPAGLLKDHATKPGVWGLIHVVQGALIYRIKGSKHIHDLGPQITGIIEPEILHSVELVGETEFFVEFWRSESAATTATSKGHLK